MNIREDMKAAIEKVGVTIIREKYVLWGESGALLGCCPLTALALTKELVTLEDLRQERNYDLVIKPIAKHYGIWTSSLTRFIKQYDDDGNLDRAISKLEEVRE